VIRVGSLVEYHGGYAHSQGTIGIVRAIDAPKHAVVDFFDYISGCNQMGQGYGIHFDCLVELQDGDNASKLST
jgi:hypothetical protein